MSYLSIRVHAVNRQELRLRGQREGRVHCPGRDGNPPRPCDAAPFADEQVAAFLDMMQRENKIMLHEGTVMII